jgi:2-polyprenyl-6-methoxyphenol hydroxylase-like FAD-dependent oxidoreductase
VGNASDWASSAGARIGKFFIGQYIAEGTVRMRVLIVGGGVAGLTLAAKLRQQGREPVVVEKSPDYGDVGYGIGLYPLGSCVLHGLGAYDELARRSLEVKRYEIADHLGEVLQGMDMSAFTAEIGPMLMMSRSDLIDVLRGACGDLPIRMGTTVTGIEQSADTVEVSLSDGTSAVFDLVVGCDGIHSELRKRVFGPGEKFDCKWTCWTWWGREDLFPEELVREYWGRGWFFGGYPCPGKRVYVVGLPNTLVEDPHAPQDAVRQAIEKHLAELIEHDQAAAAAMAEAPKFFAWPMFDVRMEHWSKGRIALCGDSGMGFLPTAGVGASNALRSAAALADELSRADSKLVPLALELYEKRCYSIIKANQQDSRTAGRMMFLESNALSWGRDQLLKHVSMKSFISSIIASMKEPF